MRKNHVTIISVSVICIVAIIATLLLCAFKIDMVVMHVYGEPVTEKEFLLFMNKERSAVTTYFKNKYNADDQKDYWTKSYNGEIPNEVLKARAYKECVEAKILQVLAKQQGLVEDISFDSVLTGSKNFNGKQKQSAAENKVISGLGQYSVDNFYTYYLSNLKMDLEEKLGENILKISDEDIKEYYNANPESYKNKNELTIAEIYIPYEQNGKAAAYEKAEHARAILEKGIDFSDACKKYNSDGKMQESTFILGDSISQLKSNKEIMETAKNMSVGEFSNVVDRGSGYSIIKLLSQKKDSEISFSDVSSQIQSTLLRQKFDDYMEQQVKKSDVVINKKAYEKMQIK